MPDRKEDTRGMLCPMPLAKISQALKEMACGQTLEVAADDPVFRTDVQVYCQRTGHVLQDLKVSGGAIIAVIKKST